MSATGILPILIILANVLVSIKAFNDRLFYERYVFEIDKIRLFKEYYRLATSGFLHAGWFHLIFNMLSLYAFSGVLVQLIGSSQFLLLYAVSLVGSALFSLFMHRNDGAYRAVGASGAVCGVMFASIALFPGMGVGLFPFPFSIPGWVYGFVYMIYCIYGMRARWGSVAHDAHFGGAIIGVLMVLLLYPEALQENYVTILLILVPSLIFLYMLIRQPHFLLVQNKPANRSNHYSIDHRYNAARQDRQKELDRLLEKIHKRGMDSLTQKERDLLKEYSEKGFN